MPRGGFAYKPKSDIRDTEIKAIIEAGLARKRMTKIALAKKLGIPYATLMKHLTDIGFLRYKELRDIFDTLDIPSEERGRVL